LSSESSDGAAENVQSTTPSTRNGTALANASNEATTVTEKSSEPALKILSSDEQESSVAESGDVTMEDAEAAQNRISKRIDDEIKDIVNDLKTEADTNGDIFDSHSCDIMMLETEASEFTEKSAVTKSETRTSSNTHCTDTKETIGDDTNTARDKDETFIFQKILIQS
jgi:hypothetical protein